MASLPFEQIGLSDDMIDRISGTRHLGQRLVPGAASGICLRVRVSPEFHNFSFPQTGPAVAHPRFLSLPR